MNIKKILTIFLIGIFLLSFTSAVKYDFKINDETSKYGKYEIYEDYFIFWKGEKLRDVELTENTESCSDDCFAIMSMKIYKEQPLIEGVEFYRIFEDGSQVLSNIRSYNFYINTKGQTKEIDKWENVCDNKKISENGTIFCEYKIVGKEKINLPDWSIYHIGEVMPKGDYLVKLEGKKRPDWIYDWIIKTNNVKLKEWAIWGNISEGDEAEVVLISPEDNDTSVDSNVNFTCSANVTNGAGIVNMSFWLDGVLNESINVPYSLNNISTITYDNTYYKTKDVYSDDVFFNPSGTKMMIFYRNSGSSPYVGLLDLSPAWDIDSGASETYKGLPTGSNSKGMQISDDGLSAYLFDSYSSYRRIYRYTMTPAWSFSSLGYVGSTADLTLPSFNYAQFGNNGSKLYLMVDSNNLTQYNLTIPYNASSAVYDYSFNFVSSHYDFKFLENGSKVFFRKQSNVFVGYDLMDNWDFRSITNETGSKTISTTFNSGFAFKNDSSKVYLMKSLGNTLYQYSLLNYPNYTSTFTKELYLNTYDWTCSACDSDGDCGFATENRSVSGILYLINSINYSNTTLSGSIEDFNINVSVASGYDLTSANLIYNGTKIGASIITSGNNRFIYVNNYELPKYTNNTNVTFYWNFTINGETYKSIDYVQLVNAVLLGNCSTYSFPILNITLYDEKTKAIIRGDMELNYQILNKPNYNQVNQLLFKFTNVTNASICSGINLSAENLAYSTEIKYLANGYAPEFYHIQRANFGSGTTVLGLYDLNLNESTEFKIIYQDDTYNFVSDAIIQLQRKYISEDIYRIVEAPLTSNDGTAALHIDLNTNKYRITVVKNGEVLDEFDNIVFKCDSVLTGECTQKLLGSINPQNDINYIISRDFAFTDPVLNDGVLQTTFSVPSSSPSLVSISMIQKDMFGNSTLCNRSITSSAGSLECNYNTTIGDSFIELSIYKDGEFISQSTYIVPEAGIDFLGNNYFIVLILLLSLVGMAFTSPEWIVINGVVTFLIAGSLWLLNGLNFVVGVGSLMWLLIVAGILIFKLAKQEDR